MLKKERVPVSGIEQHLKHNDFKSWSVGYLAHMSGFISEAIRRVLFCDPVGGKIVRSFLTRNIRLQKFCGWQRLKYCFQTTWDTNVWQQYFDDFSSLFVALQCWFHSPCPNRVADSQTGTKSKSFFHSFLLSFFPSVFLPAFIHSFMQSIIHSCVILTMHSFLCGTS